jgi:hypothetical protein
LEFDTWNLVRRCCGYRWVGSPIDSPDVEDWPYGHALKALREPFGSLHLFDFFAHPHPHVKRFLETARPMILFNPRVSGGIPTESPQPEDPDHRRGHAALLRAIVIRHLRDVPPSEAELLSRSRWRRSAGNEQLLTAVRHRQAPALWNLGARAIGDGHRDLARHWFRLAAIDGDAGSMLSLGMTYSDLGDVITAERWFALGQARIDEGGQEPRPLRMWPDDLIALAEEADLVDPVVTDEYLRRAVDRESVQAAYLLGRRTVDSDPAAGLYYLVLAAGAGVQGSEGEWAARADLLIRECTSRWGWRETRRLRKAVSERLQQELS